MECECIHFSHIFGANHYRFRWVECQLEVLRDCVTKTSVEAALSDLPNTLDETYDRILENIDRQHLEYVRTAFALLLVTCRPLKVEELAEAVVVAPYCKAIDVEDRLFDPKDIIMMCGGLVVRIADTNEVRFAHYSVREYLLSPRISSGSAASFALSWASAEQKVSEICLTYLLSFDERDSMYRDVMVDYPFLSYSMYHWHNHIYLHGDGNSASLPSLCSTFFDAGRNRAYANWISMLDFEVYYDAIVFTGVEFEHPVTVMMVFGRRDIARTLLLDWRAWHSHGHDCDNALRLAAKTIDRTTLETLIGSDFEIIDERLACRNILNTAVSDAELVSEIIPSQFSGLARRSPILAQYWLCTALDAALNAPHQQLVKILLEAGADAHVNGPFKDPDLVIAIQHCNNRDEVLEIVKMLLGHGADINCHSNAHDTLLHNALGSGHSQLARYLLDRGADNNMEGGENGTTLKAALAGNRDRAAQSISSSADGNTTVGWTGTPLQAATYTDHIELMRLLIRSGADVNLAAPIALHNGEAYCYYGGSPFREHWMCSKRASDQFSWSELAFWEQALPIKIACQNGSLEAVKLLLDSGVNLEAREIGHSTLHWSIVRSDWTASRREIVRLLIDAGDRLSISEITDKSSANLPCLDGPNAMPVDRPQPSEADLEHLLEEWHQKFYSAMTDGSETQINDLIDTICSRNLVE
jgi:ankyrin repeat protein